GGVSAARYRLPTPLFSLRQALLDHARAAADVSDGLLADADHVARASGLGLMVELDRLPLSTAAAAWCEGQSDEVAARLALATGGDDYALVCAVDPDRVGTFIQAVQALGVSAARVGAFLAGRDLTARFAGAPVAVDRLGWRH
ncbi:MAG: AIR synthase-related protein, partial [Caulobacteraceae bacterium]